MSESNVKALNANASKKNVKKAWKSGIMQFKMYEWGSENSAIEIEFVLVGCWSVVNATMLSLSVNLPQ